MRPAFVPGSILSDTAQGPSSSDISFRAARVQAAATSSFSPSTSWRPPAPSRFSKSTTDPSSEAAARSSAGQDLPVQPDRAARTGRHGLVERPLLPSYGRSLSIWSHGPMRTNRMRAWPACRWRLRPAAQLSAGDQLRRRFGQDGGAEPRRVRQRRSNALHHHVARAGEDGYPSRRWKTNSLGTSTLCRIACRRQFPVDLQVRRRTETGRGPLRPPTLGLDHRKAGRAGARTASAGIRRR